MGVKPKFKMKWDKKDSSTYTVPGKTYEDVFKFFKGKNDKKEEWGKFSPTKPKLGFKPPKGEPITDVVLTMGYTITSPKWPKLKDANKKVKDAWDKMHKALAKHEENHRLILLEECAKFSMKVQAEEDLTFKKLKEFFDAFPGDVKKAQDLYDTKTGHGVKEGVFLPAPDKVAD